MNTRVAYAVLLLATLGVNASVAQTDAPKTDASSSAATQSAEAKVDVSAPKPAQSSSATPRFASWNCDGGSIPRTDGASTDAATQRDDAVRWSAPLEASRTVDRLAPRLEHVRIVSPTDFVPGRSTAAASIR